MIPCPKPRRLADPELVERLRRHYGCCLAGPLLKEPCSGGLDMHHITSRGAGGHDTVGNLIPLCRKHHQDAHSGRLSRAWLRAALDHYEEP